MYTNKFLVYLWSIQMKISWYLINVEQMVRIDNSVAKMWQGLGLGLWFLMSLSTIFQFNHGGLFYWWRKPECPVKTTRQDREHLENHWNNTCLKTIGTTLVSALFCTIWQLFWHFLTLQDNTIYVHCQSKLKLIWTLC